MSKKEDRIWSEGFARACEIAEEGGLEALLAEKRFRGITGTQIRLTSTEMDYASEEIKQLLMSTFEVAMLSAARDAFGFVEKRLVKLLDEFDKLSSYMANGWIYWVDLINELKTECHIEMAIKDAAGHLINYRRPEPEDMYTEADLISQKDWKDILRFLSLKDDGKEIRDETGLFRWDYKNPYEKIQLYDILCGVEYAVRFLHANRPGDEFKKFKKSEAPAPAVEPVRTANRKKGKQRRK